MWTVVAPCTPDRDSLLFKALTAAIAPRQPGPRGFEDFIPINDHTSPSLKPLTTCACARHGYRTSRPIALDSARRLGHLISISASHHLPGSPGHPRARRSPFLKPVAFFDGEKREEISDCRPSAQEIRRHCASPAQPCQHQRRHCYSYDIWSW